MERVSFCWDFNDYDNYVDHISWMNLLQLSEGWWWKKYSILDGANTQNPCRGSNCANVQDVEGSFLKHHPKLLHWNCKALNQRLTKKLYQLHRCEAQTFFEPRWRHGWEAQGGHHRCRPRWSHLSQNLTATATPGGGVAETPKNAWLVRSPTVSNRFPLDTFGPSKKKRRCAEMLFFKKFGLNKFWPDHVSDCFRPFPTVSDRFRPFHFFWTINWPTSIYGRLIQCKPVQTMTLKFFGATLLHVHCTTYCILTLISNIP